MGFVWIREKKLLVDLAHFSFINLFDKKEFWFSVILGGLIVYTQINEKTVQVLKCQLQDFLK